MPQRNLSYSIVDVFAEKALEGNPLAIFHDASTLSTAEMQALARETNLSETTFILPAADESRGVRVRIFTTQEELPFAGHPTLGTASWLFENHPVFKGADQITIALTVGPIQVRFTAPQQGKAGVLARMTQKNPTFGMTHDRLALADALGFSMEDLDPHHAPQTVSTGVPFCIVLLHSLEAAARLNVEQRKAQHYLDSTDAEFFYCIAPAATAAEPAGPHWYARMQFYGGEDPATGSAAGCCIAWLVRNGLTPSKTDTVIAQGVHMGRPSRIVTQATLEADKVSNVQVSGRTIHVATGSFFLP